MMINLFGRRKANKKVRRAELRVAEGVDLRSRKMEHKKILGYRREILISIDPDNKKALSTY